VGLINDAAAFGVTVEPAPVAEGARWRWECVKVHHLTPAENCGNHNLYVNLLQEDGKRAVKRTAWASWPGDTPQEINFGCILQDKPDNEPGGNMPVWKGQRVDCGVNTNADEVSDVVRGIHTNHPDEPPAVPGGDKGNTTYHHSFLAEFRRVGLGEADDPAEPPVTPPVDPGEGPGDADPSLPPTVPEKYWGWREQVGQALSLALYRLACVVNRDQTKGAAATAGVDAVRKGLQ
jgi:hypothetical protein